MSNSKACIPHFGRFSPLAFHGSYIADFVIRVLGVQNIGPGDFNIRTADQTPSASTTTREPIGTRR